MEYFLANDDEEYRDLIEESMKFLCHLLPNKTNIFQLYSLDDRVISFVKKNYNNFLYLIYPVYKHLWKNSNVFKGEKRLECIEQSKEHNFPFFNVSNIDFTEIDNPVIEGDSIVIGEHTCSFEAYSFIFLEKRRLLTAERVNHFFILGLIEAGMKLGCVNIPWKQGGSVPNKYNIFPAEINLSSLYISTQVRVFDAWRKEKDILITGGTGTGKTSQIPKLFWWFNMWFDGLGEIDFDSFFFSLDVLGERSIESRSTTLSLPRKVLITSNSSFALKSLGFNGIQDSPIFCRFKDVKKTIYYNSSDFITPFIFSVNRSTNYSNVNTIIFDEIHEHDTYCDIGIAITKKKKKELGIRNIVLITATITNDLSNLKEFFPELVELKMKDATLYPIEDINLSTSCSVKNDFNGIEKIIRKYSVEKGKSTLLFLPSMKQIEKMEDKLKSLDSFYIVFQLHREVLLEDSQLINKFYNYPKQHVIILSTPIAESSITINNTKVVIDSGLFFNKEFYGGNIRYVTESMLQQRKGRVGRVSKGTYVRLYPDSNINQKYKKINYEFLLPYIVSFSYHRMTYKDLLIKPEEKRYLDTIQYYKKKGIDFSRFAHKIYEVYNRHQINIGEYIIIYMNGTTEEKKCLTKLESIDQEKQKLFIDMNYTLLKQIVKKMGIILKPIREREDNVFQCVVQDPLEQMGPLYTQIFYPSKNKRVYFLGERIAIS